ncbi:MAG: HlyD family secretion protein [Gammaproteobacteria bacterium]
MNDTRQDSPDTNTRQARNKSEQRKRLRKPLMLAGAIAILAGAGYLYFTSGRYESTDDAYVKAATVAISADVAGRVNNIAVHDNQHVHKGDVLFRLDDATYRIAVDQARAALADARLKVQMLKATYRQRQADVATAQANLKFAQTEYRRQHHLAATRLASEVQLDRASHARADARSQLEAARQALNAAVASLAGNPEINPDQHPAVQQAQAKLNHALMNLQDTVVRAPTDGIVTRVEELQVGNYIQAATPVFALVSSHDIWIEANFKENQITHMHAGDIARVEIDSYPGKTFVGKLVSLSPGTGTQFSVLPPENATGNWVKVVQRLPVRIELVQQDARYPLKAGLSASVRVDTRYQRQLFGKARIVKRNGNNA